VFSLTEELLIVGRCAGRVWLEVGPRWRVPCTTLRHAFVSVPGQWSTDLLHDNDHPRSVIVVVRGDVFLSVCLSVFVVVLLVVVIVVVVVVVVVVLGRAHSYV